MPGAIQSSFSNELFTAFEYVQKYGTPAEKRMLMERHNYPKNFFHMLDELGLITGSGGEAVVWHLEDDWIKDHIVVKSIVNPSGGPGNPITIELDQSNMFSKNGVAFSYPYERQQIRIPGSGEIAYISEKVTTSNPHRLKLIPVDPTVNLNGKIVAGGTYAIIGNAYAEGTGGAKSVISNENRYENYFQIFKKKFNSTGTGLTLQAPYSVHDVGEGKNIFIVRNSNDTEIRHRDEISNTLLVGKKSNQQRQYSDALGTDAAVYQTEGYWEAALTKGKTYLHNGHFDLSDFNAVANILEGERISSDVFMFLMGYGLEGLAEDSLYQVGVSNAGIYNYAMTKFKVPVETGHSAEDFFTYIGFSGIKKRQKTFLFKTLTDFNDPKGLGSTGYEFPKCGIITAVSTMDNKKKRANTPSVGAQYRELGSYSRKMEFTTLGGADMVQATTDVDGKEWHLRSEIGGDWALLNQVIAVKP